MRDKKIVSHTYPRNWEIGNRHWGSIPFVFPNLRSKPRKHGGSDYLPGSSVCVFVHLSQITSLSGHISHKYSSTPAIKAKECRDFTVIAPLSIWLFSRKNQGYQIQWRDEKENPKITTTPWKNQIVFRNSREMVLQYRKPQGTRTPLETTPFDMGPECRNSLVYIFCCKSCKKKSVFCTIQLKTERAI